MSNERPMFTDADLTHPWVERYRIPLVDSPWPTWKYEVALVRPGYGNHGFWADAQWPTEDEARLIGCAIDFCRDWYREGYQQTMLARPLDVDSGTNTVILMKLPRGWVYRRATHEYGPLMFPSFDADEQYPDLMPLLDKIWDLTDNWPKWKAERWSSLLVTGDGEANR